MAERVLPVGLAQRMGMGRGLTLVQHPVSPFCTSIRTLLEAASVPHRLHNVAIWDRRPVINLTDGAYYAIPVLVDGDRDPPVVVYESHEEAQDIGRYVDAREKLGLFPSEHEGLHELVVQYIEGQVEDVGFRLNDMYFLPELPDVVERTMYVRHKERKFGKGCLSDWLAQKEQLIERLTERLTPLDRMLSRNDYLFGARPVFADYALYGVLDNYLYSGHNALPASLTHLGRWHAAVPAYRLR